MEYKYAYLTYLDPPSGIYSSQVIDVVKFINSNLGNDIRLISLISIRQFFLNRSRIKKEIKNAIVLPAFPKLKNWSKNIFLLSLVCKIYKINAICSRSVVATQIALALKSRKKIKKIIYDGRGAIAAEWSEYKVVTDSNLLQQIDDYERIAVLRSDLRLSVSNKLIEYWKLRYGYNKKEHVVIPCTFNNLYENLTFTENKVKDTRAGLGFEKDEIIYVYSGSVAGWQSLDNLMSTFKKLLSYSSKIKMLFLTDKNESITDLIGLFPGRVLNKRVAHDDVPSQLMACDYGILLREDTVTNQVAAPVKFAEYLSCGLRVIISENIGDYSDVVNNEPLIGSVYDPDKISSIVASVSFSDKSRIREYSLKHFSKNAYSDEYGILFNE